MSREVRLGRKEAKRQLTARERQTYDRQKAASRGRRLTIRDNDWLTTLEKFGLPAPATLETFIDTLIVEQREGGGDTDRHAERLFDPDLADFAELPVGLLDHKELPIPDGMIPRSRDDLLALCERMIALSRNPELLSYVVGGWPGSTISRSELRYGRQDLLTDAANLLDRHVGDLWQLSGVAPRLYEAIVTGRHGTALRLLHEKRIPMFSSEAVLTLLERHGLIWCAHDLQLIVARARVAAENPFGAMIGSGKVELKPEGVANPLRRYFTLLRLVMSLYVTEAEEHEAIDPRPVQRDVPTDPGGTLRSIAARANRLLGPMLAELVKDRTALDRLHAEMRALKFHGDPIMLDILETPVSANQLGTHFAGIWFSGLSHVQVTGVAVLRYLQAEAWIKRLVTEWHPDARVRTTILRDGPAMTPFDPGEMTSGWQGHARDLLQLYRRETLRDKMAPKPGASLDPCSNAGNEVIKCARQYLAAQPQRRIEDCVGNVECARRTFYLIDLIPEARLAR